MKKFIFMAVCAIFIFSLSTTMHASFAECEKIEFCYGSKSFFYEIKERESDNIFYSHTMLPTFDNKSDLARQQMLIKLHSAGIPTDVAVMYIFPDIENVILRMDKYLSIAPSNAKLEINTNSSKVFNIKKETIGQKLDRSSLYSNLKDKILNNQPLVIDLKTIKIEPSIFSKDFTPYTNLRSDFSTDISSSSAERKHNIKNAINSINLTTIEPNEIFSFNDIVGRRTAENGYRTAKIIVNNEFVEGLGGGVCQVSTTLYNSALLAGLEIKEANKHSRPVSYVKSGFDAMVNYGSSDLKIKNNTNQRITIVANYSSNKIRIRIFGEDPADTYYKLTSEIVERTPAGEVKKFDETGEYRDKVIYTDEFFVEKKASDGMKINSFRSQYKNGELVSTEKLRTDDYKPIDAILIYGSKPRPNSVDLPDV